MFVQTKRAEPTSVVDFEKIDQDARVSHDWLWEQNSHFYCEVVTENKMNIWINPSMSLY